MIKPDLKQRDSATQFRVFLRVALSVGQENKFWDALSGACGAVILVLLKYVKVFRKFSVGIFLPVEEEPPSSDAHGLCDTSIARSTALPVMISD